MQTPETYSLAQVAQILGVARSTILRHVDQGTIPAIRLGARTLVPRSYVDRLFSEAGCPREVSA